MEYLSIIDIENGDEVIIPISDFSKRAYLNAITNNRHNEINLNN